MSVRYYCLSILDKHHHPDISLEQGMKLLQMCTDELKRRLPIDYKGVRSQFTTQRYWLLQASATDLLHIGPCKGRDQGWCQGSRGR
jgi:hypothetical protein